MSFRIALVYVSLVMLQCLCHIGDAKDATGRYSAHPLMRASVAQAKTACHQRGGWFASIPDTFANTLVLDALADVTVNTDFEYAFGAQFQGSVWRWLDGPLVGVAFSDTRTGDCDGSAWKYCSWHNNVGRDGEVAAFESATYPTWAATKNGYWNDNVDADTDVGGYICEYAVPKDQQYVFYDKKLSSTEAQDWCRRRGAWLATIRSADDQERFLESLPPTLSLGTSKVLFGGVADVAAQRWKWLGGPIAGVAFSDGSSVCLGRIYCSWSFNTIASGMVATVSSRSGPFWSAERDNSTAIVGFVCQFEHTTLTSSNTYSQSTIASKTATESVSLSQVPTSTFTRSSTDSATSSGTESSEPSDTISIVPSVSIQATYSLMRLTKTQQATRSGPAKTRTLVPLNIRFMEPDVSVSDGVVTPISIGEPLLWRHLSEKAMAERKAEGSTITLAADVAGWNCSWIVANRFSFFTPLLPMSSNENTTNASTARSFSAEFESSLRSTLLPSSAVECSPDSNVVGFTLRGTDDFRVQQAENFTFVVDIQLAMHRVLSSGLYTGYEDTTGVIAAAAIRLVHDRPLPVLTVPKAVVKAATTTGAVSSVVTAAAGNPAMAVQGARTALILSLVQCEDNTPDGLEWMSHPTQLEVGLGVTSSWAGAAMWNPIVVFGTTIMHFGLALLYRAVKAPAGTTVSAALSTFYFPALQAIVVMPLLQPTVTAITTIARQSGQLHQQLSAAFGALVVVIFFGFMYNTIIRRFQAVYTPYPSSGPEKASCLRRFLTGPGEYTDGWPRQSKSFEEMEAERRRNRRRQKRLQQMKEEVLLDPELGEVSLEEIIAVEEDSSTSVKGDKQEQPQKEVSEGWVKRYFLLFDLYRPARPWFGFVEVLMTALFGVLEGFRPEDTNSCHFMIVLMAAVFLLFFVAICTLRPYVSLFESGTAFTITAAQTISAACATVYALGNIKPAIDIGGWTATGGMYFLAFKAAVDVVIVVHDTIQDRCCGAGKQAKENGSDTGELLAVPQTSALFTEASTHARQPLPLPPPKLSIHARRGPFQLKAPPPPLPNSHSLKEMAERKLRGESYGCSPNPSSEKPNPLLFHAPPRSKPLAPPAIVRRKSPKARPPDVLVL